MIKIISYCAVIITVIFFVGCVSNYKKMSYSIYKSNLSFNDLQSNKMQSFYHKTRLILNKKHEIDFINYQEDTVFVTTSYNFGYGCLVVCLFNRNGSVYASKCMGSLKDSLKVYGNKFPYSDRFKSKIFDWDTAYLNKISRVEERGSLPFIDVNRVIINQKQFQIQKVSNLFEFDFGTQEKRSLEK